MPRHRGKEEGWGPLSLPVLYLPFQGHLLGTASPKPAGGHLGRGAAALPGPQGCLVGRCPGPRDRAPLATVTLGTAPTPPQNAHLKTDFTPDLERRALGLGTRCPQHSSVLYVGLRPGLPCLQRDLCGCGPGLREALAPPGGAVAWARASFEHYTGPHEGLAWKQRLCRQD